MGSAEFGCSCLSSTLRRKAGLALAFIVFGSIAGASGVVVQMAGHEPNVGGRSVIAISLNPNAALSTAISPPAVSAPDNRQDSAPPSNSAQAAPVDATPTAVTAPNTTAATELAPQPVTASEKSQKAAPSQNRRDQGWYDASAGRQHLDYGRGRPRLCTKLVMCRPPRTPYWRGAGSKLGNLFQSDGEQFGGLIAGAAGLDGLDCLPDYLFGLGL
jgi:hypothetical protein